MNGFIDGFNAIFPTLIVPEVHWPGRINRHHSLNLRWGLQAIVIYNIGKKVKHKDHPRVFAIWVAFNSCAILVFSFFLADRRADLFCSRGIS